MIMKDGPQHPGELLVEKFLQPNHATPESFAATLNWDENELVRVCKGKKRISPELGRKLSEFLGTDADFWLDLQKHYDEEKKR